MVAKLDFMETCNTKYVCIHVTNQLVEFGGNISQFIFLPHYNVIKVIVELKLYNFLKKRLRHFLPMSFIHVYVQFQAD